MPSSPFGRNRLLQSQRASSSRPRRMQHWFMVVVLAAPVRQGSVARIEDLAAPAAEHQKSGQHWKFAVTLDGKQIGWHEFTVNRDSTTTTVDSQANFTVTKLLIPLYRYEHRDRERWEAGCLVAIDAQTRDNGKDNVVRGHHTSEGLQLEAPHNAVLPGCMWSFAYWDVKLLQQHRLLNAQTGDYEPVQVVHRGSEPVRVREREVMADHYSIVAPKFTIELWYSDAGEWIRLQSRTARGTMLSYELQ